MSFKNPDKLKKKKNIKPPAVGSKTAAQKSDRKRTPTKSEKRGRG